MTTFRSWIASALRKLEFFSLRIGRILFLKAFMKSEWTIMATSPLSEFGKSWSIILMSMLAPMDWCCAV